jgi:gluconokinase
VRREQRLIVILMGVTGAGKTTIGRLLAAKLGWEFADADDYHPVINREKMARGVALTDADRAPWLTALRAAILEWQAQRKNVVLACSALKREYREKLGLGAAERLVYLKGSRELIGRRLRARPGHFATEAILDDQFRTLEEPEDAITVDVHGTPQQIVQGIQARLRLCQDPGSKT